MSTTYQLPSSAIEEFSPEICSGLVQLLRAYDYSRDLECSLWDFSVEMERLLATGMTTSDLRWMVKRGYLAHARDISEPHDADRHFDSRSRGLTFSKSTCFVLTGLGLAQLGREATANDDSDTLSPETLAPAIQLPTVATASRGIEAMVGLPSWDRDTRTFLVGEELVKQFRVPSPNQEAVLDAFQEEGWPRSVDDPLPPVPDQQPKRRLRDTIKCLNMNQVSRAIRFRGDGTGQRVFWELLTIANAPRENLPLRRAA